MTAVRNVVITGTGSYAPERVVTNDDWAKLVDTSDEWITTRTGMKERRFARDDEMTSDMAAEAARRAMDAAGVKAEEVDMIITPTITPDRLWPNTACLVQTKIGATNAFCYGLEAACTGFLYGVETARQFVATGTVKTALVTAAEKMSAVLDPTDRNSCVLFGDGAGAAVLQATDGAPGIIGSSMGSDGSLHDLLMLPAGGCLIPTTEESVKKKQHYLHMDGRETFKHAVTKMAGSARSVIEENGLQVADIDWFIPHQANMRIIQAVGQRLGVPTEQFIVNIEKYGNTSSATIPLAL
ncbi:MAG: ketoacyl-ACP synthase III, partial [Spartobacteria bacterium]|nr:ketoacyl-ACP synthase III [Spartobacteria bacterium]